MRLLLSAQVRCLSHPTPRSENELPMMIHLTKTISLLMCAVFVAVASAETPTTDSGFTSLFDGKTMNGWKLAEENQNSWHVEDGKLMCDGERCHLYYVGELAPLTNFHFKAEVMTTPGSNAGIYFHTAYQPVGWPKQGFECQVNVSHKDPKKTSSLYAVENVADPGVKDNEWYTQEIIVRGKHVVLKVNGKTMVDYTEAGDQKPFDKNFERLVGSGTFALQAHDPKSKVYFRNLQVKKID